MQMKEARLDSGRIVGDDGMDRKRESGDAPQCWLRLPQTEIKAS